MISTPHRQTAVVLINDAITAGARRAKACSALEISDRSLRRWTKDGHVQPDLRPLVPRPEPANRLNAAERAAVLEACNSTEFASLPPCQPSALPDRAKTGRSGAVSCIRVQLLPHPAGGWAAASPWPGQAAGAAQTTHQLQGQCALRGLELGHNVDARAGRGDVLLSLSDRGYLQPQDRRMGSS